MPDADWWQVLWPDPAKIVAEMGVPPGTVVVDLCCGDGTFTVPLTGPADRVYAIDIDHCLLEKARARVAASGEPRCHFIEADAMSVAMVVPEPADYVLLANTFHGVPDQPGLARAVAVILKPKGQFGIINWHRPAPRDGDPWATARATNRDADRGASCRGGRRADRSDAEPNR